MIEIECLACGETLKIPQFIDNDNYDGQVVCQECKSLLHVKLVKGKVQKYKIVGEQTRPVTIKYVPSHGAEQQAREQGGTVKDKED